MIDTSQYLGPCLPGFIPVSVKSNQLLINSIDHMAFAMPRYSALEAIVWYEKVFGMKRFQVNQ